MPSLLRIPWISRGWTPAGAHSDQCEVIFYCSFDLHFSAKMDTAGVQPRWVQGIRSGDGVGEDQETTA